MKIRLATENDVPEIKKLSDRCFDEVISKHHSPAVVEKDKQRNSIENLKEDLKWKVVYVADDNGKIVGTGAFADFGKEGKPKYSVSNFYVLPELHRKGIGTKIMNKLIEHAKEKRATSFHCPSARNAVPFYETFGFMVDAEQPEVEDEITWMTMSLK